MRKLISKFLVFLLFVGLTFTVNGQIYTSEVEVQSNANDNVGIGTSNPEKKLEVNGDILLRNQTGIKQIYTWTSSDPNWRIGMNANPGFTRSMATNHVQYITYSSGSDQGFATGVNGGNSSFEIRGSDHRAFFRGNVGIGTSSPSYKLDVTNSIRVRNNYILTSVGTNNEGLKVDDGVGSTVFSLTRNSGNEIRLHGYGPLTFFTNGNVGSEKMRIKTNGYVGIGRTNPSYKLDVNGSARASAWYTTSDERNKKNIKELKETENDWEAIHSYEYELEEDSTQRKHYGFLAQEIEQVYPNMVVTDSLGYKAVAYQEFIPLIMDQVKKQRRVIRQLKKQNDALNDRLIAIEEKLSKK